jgi:cytochrome c-type biogenesis protein CcmH/NrfF
MQFIFFTVLAALVAVGVQRMSRNAADARKAFARKAPENAALTAQEMIPCPVCQAYVIKDATGRAQCPQHPPSV